MTLNQRIQFILHDQKKDGTTIAGQTESSGSNQNRLFYPSDVVLDSQIDLCAAVTDNSFEVEIVLTLFSTIPSLDIYFPNFLIEDKIQKRPLYQKQIFISTLSTIITQCIK